MRRGFSGLAAVVIVWVAAVGSPWAAPARPVETIDPFGTGQPVTTTDPQAPSPPLRDEGPSDVEGPSRVEPLREAMETDMAELGGFVQEARRDGDMVRLRCLREVQTQAEHALELATSELLVVRDANAPADARRFAGEKLAAAAQRLNALVDVARACAGEQGPEDEDDQTRNEVEEPEFVPFADPTRASADFPLPPPVDDTHPPVVASPTF